MNISSTSPASSCLTLSVGQGTEVVSVVDRMKAANEARDASNCGAMPSTPVERSLEEELEKVRLEMMLQPFIEYLFYGEEEETGNVSVSTML
ncbi:hypothetical protein [Stenotrophomonas maltophilia]|uniref:hypothetical protein n=1 Tax=Stenotrophomonas maltophilia TaxID=40324 RepID=UPI001140AEE2|nr:hypothetical protein [Stenotrophomonas maltophilia]